MKIELDRKKKITLLEWLKQGYIETEDMPEMVQSLQIQICRTKQDVENADNPEYWKEAQ